MAARRIGIQIAADESQFLDAAFQFRGAVDRCDSRRLRQLANTDEIIRIKRHDTLNQVVAGLSPAAAGRFIAYVMRHGGGAR